MARLGPSIIHSTDTIRYNTIQYIDLKVTVFIAMVEQPYNSTCAGEGAQSRNSVGFSLFYIPVAIYRYVRIFSRCRLPYCK